MQIGQSSIATRRATEAGTIQDCTAKERSQAATDAATIDSYAAKDTS